MAAGTRRAGILRWVVSAVAILLLALWIFSLCVHSYWNDGEGLSFSLHAGVIGYYKVPKADAPPRSCGMYSSPPGSPSQWWFLSVDVPPRRIIWTPLWVPTAVAAIPAVALWWPVLRRRRGPGQCQGCGYDRGGLAADAACPECGKV